ncbi:hypothetical protein N9Z67_01475 [Rhodopirellula sp.]|nr:hypothetical protein [Rhodopirellula sp.]MDB4770858.1 hypothetical protein [bacterium]
MDRFLSHLLSSLLLLTAAGCTTWGRGGSQLNSDTNDQLAESSPQRSFNRKRVILDVEFVNSASSELTTSSEPSVWRWVDETRIDPSVRKHMLGNGIRVGLINNEEEFRKQLDTQEEDRDLVGTFLAEASIASDLAHGSQSMPMRLGRRYELPLRQPLEGSHVAMLREGDELIGKTMQNAQYILAMTSSRGKTPEQIELKIHPEIQHGDTVQKWVSSDTALRIDSRREAWQLECLNLNLNVQEGDLIVIAPTQPLRCLAKHMLSGTGSDNQHEQLIILIRVAQIPTLIDEI